MFPFIGLGQINKLEEKKGISNYILGTSPDHYKNLQLELNEGLTKLYSVHGEPVKLEDFELDYLRLTFYKNKLSGISFQTKNHDADKLFQKLKETYGEPEKNKDSKVKFTWVGDKLHLVYEKHLKSNEATVSFYSDAVY